MDTPVREQPSLLLIEEDSILLNSLRDWLSVVFPDVRLIQTSDHSNGVFINQFQSPDVVLMDISDLGKNGVERVHAMKTAQPAATLFALVSLDHESYRQTILRAGAEACACIWRLRKELLPQLKECLLPKNGDGQSKRQ